MPFDITVTGSIKNKKQVAIYAHDVLSSFFTQRFRRRVDVWIHICKKLEPGYYGLSHGDKNEVWLDISKGYVDPASGNYHTYDYSTVLITLAHELVHAKQIIKGQLSSNGRTWIHQGKQMDCTAMSYKQLPWEKEADLLETRLFVEHWLQKYNQ